MLFTVCLRTVCVQVAGVTRSRCRCALWLHAPFKKLFTMKSLSNQLLRLRFQPLAPPATWHVDVNNVSARSSVIVNVVVELSVPSTSLSSTPSSHHCPDRHLLDPSYTLQPVTLTRILPELYHIDQSIKFRILRLRRVCLCCANASYWRRRCVVSCRVAVNPSTLPTTDDELRRRWR